MKDLRLLTWVFCGAKDPDVILKEYQRQERENCCKCTTTWGGEHVAYRCKTCGIWPSSCMCAECFDINEHKDHDFRMYSSGRGGCCDCGDPAAWKTSGFCSRHKAALARYIDPVQLLDAKASKSANAVLGAVITSIVPVCIEYIQNNGSIEDIHNSAMAYIQWVILVVDVFEGFRTLLCEIMFDSEYLSYYKPSLSIAYGDELTSLVQVMLKTLVHMPPSTILTLGNLHLKLLLKPSFKSNFVRVFVVEYGSIAEAQLQKAKPPDSSWSSAIQTYMDKIICQLFVDSDSVLQLDARTGFIRSMIGNITHALLPHCDSIKCSLVPETESLATMLKCENMDSFMVLDPSFTTNFTHALSRLISDVLSALANDTVARQNIFEYRPSLLKFAFKILSVIQGTYAITRITDVHIEHDNPKQTYQIYEIVHAIASFTRAITVGVHAYFMEPHFTKSIAQNVKIEPQSHAEKEGYKSHYHIGSKHIFSTLPPAELVIEKKKAISDFFTLLLCEAFPPLLQRTCAQQGYSSAGYKVSTFPVSLQIPIHHLLGRSFAEVLKHQSDLVDTGTILDQTAKLVDVESCGKVWEIILDPIACSFSALAQTTAGMWRKNGHVMPYQAYFIRVFEIGQEPDLLLLQLGFALNHSMKVTQQFNPLKLLLQRFEIGHLTIFVNVDDVNVNNYLHTDARRADANRPGSPLWSSGSKDIPLFDKRNHHNAYLLAKTLTQEECCLMREFLILLINITVDRRWAGAGFRRSLRQDVLHLLAATMPTNDPSKLPTFSLLFKTIACNDAKHLSGAEVLQQDFHEIVSEVGEYHEPRIDSSGKVISGHFTLKTKAWSEVQPFDFVLTPAKRQSVLINAENAAAEKTLIDKKAETSTSDLQKQNHCTWTQEVDSLIQLYRLDSLTDKTFPIFQNLPRAVLNQPILHNLLFAVLVGSLTPKISLESTEYCPSEEKITMHIPDNDNAPPRRPSAPFQLNSKNKVACHPRVPHDIYKKLFPHHSGRSLDSNLKKFSLSTLASSSNRGWVTDSLMHTALFVIGLAVQVHSSDKNIAKDNTLGAQSHIYNQLFQRTVIFYPSSDQNNVNCQYSSQLEASMLELIICITVHESWTGVHQLCHSILSEIDASGGSEVQQKLYHSIISVLGTEKGGSLLQKLSTTQPATEQQLDQSLNNFNETTNDSYNDLEDASQRPGTAIKTKTPHLREHAAHQERQSQIYDDIKSKQAAAAALFDSDSDSDSESCSSGSYSGDIHKESMASIDSKNLGDHEHSNKAPTTILNHDSQTAALSKGNANNSISNHKNNVHSSQSNNAIYCAMCREICAQDDPQDRIFGKITYVQPTRLLNHVMESAEMDMVMSNQNTDVANFAVTNHPITSPLKLIFDRDSHHFNAKVSATMEMHSSSAIPTVHNIAGQLHIGGCDHYLHDTCLDAYRKSLRQNVLSGYKGQGQIIVEAGEFACPLCNQVANTILPVMSCHSTEDESQKSPKIYSCTSLLKRWCNELPENLTPPRSRVRLHTKQEEEPSSLCVTNKSPNFRDRLGKYVKNILQNMRTMVAPASSMSNETEKNTNQSTQSLSPTNPDNSSVGIPISSSITKNKSTLNNHRICRVSSILLRPLHDAIYELHDANTAMELQESRKYCNLGEMELLHGFEYILLLQNTVCNSLTHIRLQYKTYLRQLKVVETEKNVCKEQNTKPSFAFWLKHANRRVRLQLQTVQALCAFAATLQHQFAQQWIMPVMANLEAITDLFTAGFEYILQLSTFATNRSATYRYDAPLSKNTISISHFLTITDFSAIYVRWFMMECICTRHYENGKKSSEHSHFRGKSPHQIMHLDEHPNRLLALAKAISRLYAVRCMLTLAAACVILCLEMGDGSLCRLLRCVDIAAKSGRGLLVAFRVVVASISRARINIIPSSRKQLLGIVAPKICNVIKEHHSNTKNLTQKLHQALNHTLEMLFEPFAFHLLTLYVSFLNVPANAVEDHGNSRSSTNMGANTNSTGNYSIKLRTFFDLVPDTLFSCFSKNNQLLHDYDGGWSKLHNHLSPTAPIAALLKPSLAPIGQPLRAWCARIDNMVQNASDSGKPQDCKIDVALPFCFYEICEAKANGQANTNNSKTLTLVPRGSPRIISLPVVYFDFFFKHRRKPIQGCKVSEKESADAIGMRTSSDIGSGAASERAICLLCGEVICAARNCCWNTWKTRRESCLQHHTRKCSLNCGVFILLYDTTTIVASSRRLCRWGPLYLDKFGEPDHDMNRGQTVSIAIHHCFIRHVDTLINFRSKIFYKPAKISGSTFQTNPSFLNNFLVGFCSYYSVVVESNF